MTSIGRQAPAISATRIEAKFRDLRRTGEKGLVIYVTAGDPDLDATGEILHALDQAGADVIELGVPFSDPLADGPVIQRASERALRAGTTLSKIVDRLPRWREAVQAPVILFSYYNPILQFGLGRFASRLSEAGADGALVVDLAPEEAEDYVAVMRQQNLDTIFLAAPTSSDQRLRRLAALSAGFLYLVSRAGVTGQQDEIASSVEPLVARARRFTNLPLAVGFGISNPEQVGQIQRVADAAVVGSAVVHAIEERYGREGAKGIGEFARWLKGR